MSQIATPSYNAVIAETIKQALELSSPSTGRQGIAGFCQLKGPTGGGKSSALYRRPDPMTLASLEFIHQQGRQAILVTHRWNILHDLYQNTASQKDSQGQPFKVSILYAQDENLISAVTQKPLAHERSLQKTDLPDPFRRLKRSNNWVDLRIKMHINAYCITAAISKTYLNVLNLIKNDQINSEQNCFNKSNKKSKSSVLQLSMRFCPVSVSLKKRLNMPKNMMDRSIHGP